MRPIWARLLPCTDRLQRRQLPAPTPCVGRWAHHGIIQKDQLVADVLDACERNGLVRDDGRKAALATIASGLLPNGWRHAAGPGYADDETVSEIARLSELSHIEYGRERKSAAERLEVSLGALDAAVKEARAKRQEKDNQICRCFSD